MKISTDYSNAIEEILKKYDHYEKVHSLAAAFQKALVVCNVMHDKSISSYISGGMFPPEELNKSIDGLKKTVAGLEIYLIQSDCIIPKEDLINLTIALKDLKNDIKKQQFNEQRDSNISKRLMRPGSGQS